MKNGTKEGMKRVVTDEYIERESERNIKAGR